MAKERPARGLSKQGSLVDNPITQPPPALRVQQRRSYEEEDDDGDRSSLDSGLQGEEPQVSAIGAQIQAMYRILKGEQERVDEVEQQIYNLETAYLQNGTAGGNVIEGYEGLVKPDRVSDASGKKAIDNKDRWFSLSSLTGDVTAAKRPSQ
ncbi:hypothetical protein WJX73_000547 [Symbiochloris irregularis]|uniref:Chromatin modification-related protein EAF6 n=1 Tax=Symbiochloris irregularis TaxID=706552 RepID=A0AAW1P3C6_9CHLO